MILKRAITRYLTYFLGVSTTAFSIFLINYFLDSNEFAVWGVTNSLIYILAQLGQLTYVQYVEKYFPNLSASEKKKTLYMFIKTTFVFFPLWFFILVMLYFLNYFSKFNISNIGYLFLMITISVVIEASIEIVSKYLLTTKDTIQLDKNEFIYSKLLRLFVFTLLLFNGFSIYHLLFTNILLRAFLFFRIINLEKEPFDKVFKNILKTHIWDNNFTKIRYTFVAFGIKALLISFLNILFLFYSSVSSSEAIAIASLGVLIINNLRPAVGSLTSLLSPMISQNVEKSVKDSSLISNFLFVNSFSASIFLIVSTVFVHVYNYFLNIEALVGYNPDKIILLSFLACVISSLYYPKLWHVKFSNLENRLLKYLIIIFIITLGIFLFLPIDADLFIFYIIFELLVYLVSFVLYKTQFPKFKNKLSPSLYISVIIVLLYLNSFSYFYIQLLVYTIFSVFELKKVRVILNSKSFN
tara:strand:+ start:40311 stop:41714 length:1404 start_codon:yes stop_codon:yes gene_type:complete